jgi:hypothetical protein
MSGGLQPNSALGRKPLFPELGHICFANTSGHFAGLRRAISYRATFASEERCIGQRRRTARNIAPWRAADEDGQYCFAVAL